MNKKMILLVEDNEDDVALTQLALKKNNISNTMVVARNGEEALEYLFGTGSYSDRETSKMPAAILLDLNLPKINGLEVLKRIRADDRTQFLPVLILTTSDEENDLVEGYRLGANSYIRKPLKFDQFTEAIKLMGLYWLQLNENPPMGVRD